MNIFELFGNLPDLVGPFVSTILGLIALDVLLGVASAIRRGEFKFEFLADFYMKNVVPYVVGWIAFSAVSQFIAIELLPPDAALLVGNAAVSASFSAVVLSLVSSIVANFKELYVGKTAWELELEEEFGVLPVEDFPALNG